MVKAKCGIIKNELHLMIKDDTAFKSDVQAKDHILHAIRPYEMWAVATRQTMNGRIDEPIQRNIKSMNDIVLMFTPDEATTSDTPSNMECLLYRQDSTFFTCK